MKRLSQMNKPELLALYDRFSLMLPETEKPTNAELRDELETRYGITDEALKAFEEKKDAELNDGGKGDYSQFVEAEDGTVVIVMDRNNLSYAVGKYTWTHNRRYVPVDKKTAEEILANHTGFHKATGEEIKRNFNV